MMSMCIKYISSLYKILIIVSIFTFKYICHHIAFMIIIIIVSLHEHLVSCSLLTCLLTVENLQYTLSLSLWVVGTHFFTVTTFLTELAMTLSKQVINHLFLCVIVYYCMMGQSLKKPYIF